MVAKLFWQDPYRTSLDTRIAAVEGDVVRLEETIFYAFSGGQESDAGTIGGRKVLEARKDERDILYTLEPGHGLRPGDAVAVEIDGARRRKLMRLHLAAEIILELAYQNLPGIQKIGAHIAEDKARIDFEWPENISRLFPMMQDKGRRPDRRRPRDRQRLQRRSQPAPLLGDRRLRPRPLRRHASEAHRRDRRDHAEAGEYRQGQGADRDLS